MEKANILSILRSKKTVFSYKDILLSVKEKNPLLLNRRLSYYIKNKELYSIRKGFYAKDKDYDKYELATKIYTPSYISFETVLSKVGCIFQFYSQIFLASYLTREVKVDKQIYLYKKLKESVLTNRAGIEQKDNYSIACPERAFLDIVYLNKNYYFDKLDVLNWQKVMKILPIYNNKRMEKEINKYYKQYK